MSPIRCFVLGASLLAGSCAQRPVAPAPLPPAAAAGTTSAPAGPRLLFFSGRLSEAASGPSHLEVLQLQAVAGELKQAPADAPGPDVLRLVQLDAGGRPLSQLRLPHPLWPEVEYLRDDQRTFARSRAQVPTAEFFARLALHPDAVALRVEEALHQQSAVLASLPLTLTKP